MNKKKILVTGANGLLGQKLIYKLKGRNDVALIATSIGESRIADKEGYTYESFDITDAVQTENMLKKYQPDTIINTAAMTNVDACEADKEGCWKLNVSAVENIIKACKKYQKDKHPQLIHLSTDFVFNGEHGPYKEEDAPDPLSYYAHSKLESEKIVQASDLNWAIIRTMLVYGIVDKMSRTNIVLWAKDALSKGQKVNVVDDQFRNPTLAEDLAEACISAAFKEATGMYHISGKDFMSILDLVYTVADFFKLDKSLVNPIKSNTLNQAAKRPAITGFILDKAYKDLAYKPHSFIEGLEILKGQLI